MVRAGASAGDSSQVAPGIRRCGTTPRMSYDDRKGAAIHHRQQRGLSLVGTVTFPDVIISEFPRKSPTDLRTGGAADLEKWPPAPDTRGDRIVGVTRREATGSGQLSAERTDRRQVAEAVADGDARKGDFARLIDGADQLADGLTLTRQSVRSALGPLTGLPNLASRPARRFSATGRHLHQLNAMGPNVDRIVGRTADPPAAEQRQTRRVIDPLAALRRLPSVRDTGVRGVARPRICRRTLPTGFFDQIAGLSDELTAQTADSSVSATITQLRARGHSTGAWLSSAVRRRPVCTDRTPAGRQRKVAWVRGRCRRRTPWSTATSRCWAGWARLRRNCRIRARPDRRGDGFYLPSRGPTARDRSTPSARRTNRAVRHRVRFRSLYRRRR